MNGLSLHYYTLTKSDWRDKGSTTEFDEAQWFSTMKNTLFMEALITRHSSDCQMKKLNIFLERHYRE